MIIHIGKSEYQMMPWKNGLGATAQIAIYPETAEFPGEDFLWRLSSATVRTSSPFSQFPGCDRVLVVWKGEGLRLNGTHLAPLVPFEFPGEAPIKCELLGSEVLDLGIILRRGKVQATMEVKDVHSNVKVLRRFTGVHFLFCVHGDIAVQGVVVGTGDTVKIEAESHVEISSPSGARYVEMSVSIL